MPTDPTVIIEKDDTIVESKAEEESFQEMFKKYDESFIKNDSWISSPEESSVVKQELIANVHSIVNDFETKEEKALKAFEEQLPYNQESFLIDETSDKSPIETRSVANIQITTNQKEDLIEDTKESGMMDLFAKIVVGAIEQYNDGNKKTHARSLNGDLTTNELRQDSDELIVQEFSNKNNTQESIASVIESIDTIVDPQIRNEFKADINGKTDIDMEEKIIIKTIQPDIEYKIQHFVPEIKENITKLTTHEKENLQAEIINQFLHKNETDIDLPKINDAKQIPDVIEVLEHIIYAPEINEMIHEETLTTQSIISEIIEMIPKDRHTRLRSMEEEREVATTTDLPMSNDKFVGFEETGNLIEAGSETTDKDMFFEAEKESETNSDSETKDDFETVVLALMMAKSLDVEKETVEYFTTELPLISIDEQILKTKPEKLPTNEEIQKVVFVEFAPIEIKKDIESLRTLAEPEMTEKSIEVLPKQDETTETNEQLTNIEEIQKVVFEEFSPIEIKKDIEPLRIIVEPEIAERSIELSPKEDETTETNEDTTAGSGFRSEENIESLRIIDEPEVTKKSIEVLPNQDETTETNEDVTAGSDFRSLEDRTEIWEVNTKISVSIGREFDNIAEIIQDIETRNSLNVEFVDENFLNSTVIDESENDLVAMERKIDDSTQKPDEEKVTTTSKTVEINEKSNESDSNESSEEENKEKKLSKKKLDNSSESDESEEKSVETVTKQITEFNNSGLEANSSEEDNSNEKLRDILTKKPLLDFLNPDSRIIFVDATEKITTKLPTTEIETEENQGISVENFFQDLRSHDVRKKDHVNAVEFENDIVLIEPKKQQITVTTAVPSETYTVSLNLTPSPESEVVESTSEAFDDYLTTLVQGIELTNDVKMLLQNFRSSFEKASSVPDTNNEIVSSKNTRDPVGIDIQEIKSQGRFATDNSSKFWVIGSTSVFLVGIVGFLCVMYFKNFFQLHFNLLK